MSASARNDDLALDDDYDPYYNETCPYCGDVRGREAGVPADRYWCSCDAGEESHAHPRSPLLSD